MKIKQENTLNKYMRKVNEAKRKYLLESIEYRKKILFLKENDKREKKNQI